MKKLRYVIVTIGGVISIGSQINEGIQLIKTGLPTPIWTAIGLTIFFVGVWAVVHYKDATITGQPISITMGGIESHRNRFKTMRYATNLKNQMHRKHKYTDNDGIDKDLQNPNIDPNEIMNRKCSICGKPRNVKGDSVIHGE